MTRCSRVERNLRSISIGGRHVYWHPPGGKRVPRCKARYRLRLRALPPVVEQRRACGRSTRPKITSRHHTRNQKQGQDSGFLRLGRQQPFDHADRRKQPDRATGQAGEENVKILRLSSAVIRSVGSRKLIGIQASRTSTWWTHKGSNLGPLPCEGNALPLSYASGNWANNEARQSPRFTKCGPPVSSDQSGRNVAISREAGRITPPAGGRGRRATAARGCARRACRRLRRRGRRR